MLNDLIKNKNVLFIPVYSMRDRQTGYYNLDNDGNYARILSLLKNSAFKHATVLIPAAHIRSDRFDLKNVEFKVSNGYGENAHATRLEVNKFMQELIADEHIDDYDYIITEPNYLTLNLLNSNKLDKLIYWCVASHTSVGDPWFVKEFTMIDKKIASLIPTAVASKSQVDGLGGKAYWDCNFYDPSLFDYTTIFFPFRLTDENYHAKEFVEIIQRLQMRTDIRPFKVLYTDVNNSGLFDNLPGFKKISSDHDVYLQVLKSRPIIPYLEKMDMLEHISINEFTYYHCGVIALHCEYERNDPNILYINNIESLYDALMLLLFNFNSVSSKEDNNE